MKFYVVPRNTSKHSKKPNCAYLHIDGWDDWRKFRTQFFLSIVDNDDVEHDIGSVKIGQKGLRPGSTIQPGCRAPEIPEIFPTLDTPFFSLGQGETYYQALIKLDDDIRTTVLKALRDCAYNLKIFTKYKDEEVMTESLMRDFSETTLMHRFARLAHGNVALTAFEFEYVFPTLLKDLHDSPVPELTFNVAPLSTPPTNIHVLIGRNGVGKTRCLQNMAYSILAEKKEDETHGVVERNGENKYEWTFAKLIFVSFSVFDNFQLPKFSDPDIQAHQVNLQIFSKEEEDELYSERLAKEFINSFKVCRSGLRKERWLRAVNTLTTDPLFADSGIQPLLEVSTRSLGREAEAIFSNLSSGHKIILLAITKLVELVDETTIIFIDEPETHLHPPLLSAFVRALGDLLLERNGVAIIATHSPVVLQEVPRSCVWILSRSGSYSKAERPAIETFGENVGVLTREVFQLEVTESGFHQLLKSEVANNQASFSDIVGKFNGNLGGEARAILRALINDRDEGGSN